LCLKDETTPYLYYINQAINDHKDVIELIDEKIDSMNRLLEELEQARAIAIMRTTEVDKIVYIDS
jgi:phage shock protein A